MSLYERYLMPRLVDLACALPAITRQRAKVVPRASGRVLEVGFGGGRNLRHYGEEVSELLALDPHPGFLRIARRRARHFAPPLRTLELAGERIDLDSGSVDNVVMTYTLCSVDEPGTVLDEIRRVLRPGGRLFLAEHGAAPDAAVRRWQDRLTPYWRKLAGNCHMNRDQRATLLAHGWRDDELEEGYVPGPKVLTWNVWGVSRPR